MIVALYPKDITSLYVLSHSQKALLIEVSFDPNSNPRVSNVTLSSIDAQSNMSSVPGALVAWLKVIITDAPSFAYTALASNG